MCQPQDYIVKCAQSFVQREMLLSRTSPSTTINRYKNEWHFLLELNYLVKKSLFKNVENMWKCSYCDYSSVKKCNTESHVEAMHLQTSGFVCPYCQMICSTRKALSSHIGRRHK